MFRFLSGPKLLSQPESVETVLVLPRGPGRRSFSGEPDTTRQRLTHA
jgi:hypothetical protein